MGWWPRRFGAGLTPPAGTQRQTAVAGHTCNAGIDSTPSLVGVSVAALSEDLAPSITLAEQNIQSAEVRILVDRRGRIAPLSLADHGAARGEGTASLFNESPLLASLSKPP